LKRAFRVACAILLLPLTLPTRPPNPKRLTLPPPPPNPSDLEAFHGRGLSEALAPADVPHLSVIQGSAKECGSGHGCNS